MTKEEQLKQNAHDYTYTNNHNWTWDDSGESRVDISAEISDAYLAGAHSRDEEIGRMNTTIRLYANQIDLLRKEIEQLRNPWISVEERLPVENQDILISHCNENVTRINCVSTGYINYMKERPDLIKYWMLTPKVEKNESK